MQRIGVQFVATSRLGRTVPVREVDATGADLVALFSQRHAAVHRLIHRDGR